MMTSQRQATANLVHNGEYSDLRFVNMMSAHHAMAVSMAEVAVEKGEHSELVQFAKTMIEDQKKEIETLDGIIEDLDGPDEVATETHPRERSMLGMDSPEELAKKAPFDKAFIDSQLPHHASAIEMAAVALKQSSNNDIKKLSRSIIDAQAQEIGKMIDWRHSWYGGRG
ncbi:DUF305 domain-containing protein [Sulfitobacter pontiacus]|jgi:uncharacterized protein (DUF305 family)|nr:DUF305 domain-containing protein [Sulfitobacter pontiacus]